MKLKCVIDKEKIEGNYDSQMPLSILIKEIFAEKNNYQYDCDNNNCMKCLVRIEKYKNIKNRILILSCLTPLYKISECEIITIEEFKKSDNFNDVIKAYEENKLKPCKECYYNRTFIFSHIADKMMEYEKKFDEDDFKLGNSNFEFYSEMIKNDKKLCECKCLNDKAQDDIIKKIINIRRKRIG